MWTSKWVEVASIFITSTHSEDVWKGSGLGLACIWALFSVIWDSEKTKYFAECMKVTDEMAKYTPLIFYTLSSSHNFRWISESYKSGLCLVDWLVPVHSSRSRSPTGPLPCSSPSLTMEFPIWTWEGPHTVQMLLYTMQAPWLHHSVNAACILHPVLNCLWGPSI